MKDEYMAMAEMLIAKRECEEAGKKLPPIRAERAITESNDLPSLPPEIIEGIIRKGGKLLVAGASKAGKSYLLIELAIAVATGGWWLDFRCAKGRVLYVNLEIQKPQFMHRVYNVAKAVGANRTTVHENLMVANLRGKYSDITSLVDDLIGSYEPGDFDLVIIDPAYKVQPGSENDANAITRFCAELDRLVEAIDCTIAYSHHHSKGSQGGKNAQDRASGSGVFGRDADALVDMVELEVNSDAFMSEKLRHRYGAVPFRLEFILRDFKSPEPLNIWFVHPKHEVDDTDTLGSCEIRKPGRTRGAGSSRGDEARSEMETALDNFMGNRDEIDRKEFAIFSGKDVRTINKHIGKSMLFELETGASSAIIRRKRA